MGALAFGFLALLVFAIPWENMLLVEGIGTVSRLLGLAAFVLGAVSVLESRRVKFTTFHVLAVAFVGLAIASLFWTLDPQRTEARFLTYVQLVAAAWLIGQVTPSEAGVRLLLAAYVAGAYVALGGTVYALSRGLEVYYGRFAAIGFNPNDLAYILSLGIPLAWYLRSHTKGVPKWVYYLYPFVASIGVILTSSRGGLFAAIIALTFVAATEKPARVVAVSGVAVLVLLLTSSTLSLSLPDHSLGRLATIGEELAHGTLNQRTVIWRAGLDVYPSTPIVGVGAGAFAIVVAPQLGAELPAHNVFLSVLVEQGIVGLALFVAMLAVVGYTVAKMPTPERRLWLVMGAVLLVALLLGNWEWRKQLWVLLALAVTHGATLEGTKSPDYASLVARLGRPPGNRRV